MGTGPLSAVRVLAIGTGDIVAFCSRILTQLGSQVDVSDSVDPPVTQADSAPIYDAVIVGLDTTPHASAQLTTTVFTTLAAVTVFITPLGEWTEVGGHDRVTVALTGAHAVVALLAAVRHTRLGGGAVTVDIAEAEVLASCQGNRLSVAICPRADPDLADPPVLIIPCKDGYVGISTGSPDDRTYLAAMAGRDTPSSLTLPPSRGGDRFERLRDGLVDWAADRERDDLFAEAQSWRLPLVPVLTPDEVFTDPQCQARGVWSTSCDETLLPTSPFRFTLPRDAFSLGPLHPAGGGLGRGGELPLGDIKVLDLGMMWAGPYTGRILAGLGADVVKVEGPRRPDGTRFRQGACEGVFADLNRGKRSLVLDLTHPAGRDAFERLAARADVVMDNFSPRVMPNFGLESARMAAANPALLSLSMPAFGSEGPWANYVAYGGGLELITGLAGYDADGKPTAADVPYLDYLSGVYGAIAILAALLARDTTGHGCHIEVAQREVACQFLAITPNQPTADKPPPHGTNITPPSDQIHQLESYLRSRGLLASPLSDEPHCHHLARLPWLMSGVPSRTEADAPAFGADSRRILRRCANLSDAALDALIPLGVVVAADPGAKGATFVEEGHVPGMALFGRRGPLGRRDRGRPGPLPDPVGADRDDPRQDGREP